MSIHFHAGKKSGAVLLHRFEKPGLGDFEPPNVLPSVTSGEPNVTLGETLALWLTAGVQKSRQNGSPRGTVESASVVVTRVGLSCSSTAERVALPKAGREFFFVRFYLAGQFLSLLLVVLSSLPHYRA